MAKRGPIARRLGVKTDPIDVETFGLAGTESAALFARAFDVAPTDHARAAELLGLALLRASEETAEGRLKSSLSLLARLAAQADARWTLGPRGKDTRDELMPDGWVRLSTSWPRFRYAWREGLVSLFKPTEREAGTVEALDELTRMHPNEPEPTPVVIQEQFPAPKLAFGLSLLGTGLMLRSAWSDWGGRRRRR